MGVGQAITMPLEISKSSVKGILTAYLFLSLVEYLSALSLHVDLTFPEHISLFATSVPIVTYSLCRECKLLLFIQK